MNPLDELIPMLATVPLLAAIAMIEKNWKLKQKYEQWKKDNELLYIEKVMIGGPMN